MEMAILVTDLAVSSESMPPDRSINERGDDRYYISWGIRDRIV
jgi:hypothetical protein